MKTIIKELPEFNITLSVKEGEKHLWSKFHPYHYMTANQDPKTSFPNAAKIYTFYWLKDDTEILVGCLGVMFQIASYPAKRLTRVVVLPEFQGLGISSKMVNSISNFYTSHGFKVYGATFHPRLGEFREKSKNWSSGHYNQRSFKLSTDHQEKTMTGLRDGQKMYRHFYSLSTNYTLKYDPVILATLQKEIKVLEKDLTDDNAKEYKGKRKQLKEIFKYTQQKIDKQLTSSYGSLSDDDNKKYQKIGKPKRKVLTREERIALKNSKKGN